MKKKPMGGTYGWASWYSTFWLERFYSVGISNLYGSRIGRAAELQERLRGLPWVPEMFLIGNFPHERTEILALCRKFDVNTVSGEDGFFPHYETMHADPLGFCWESSLPQMVFRLCSDAQRRRAENLRAEILAAPVDELPPNLKKPFVLWPLQLIGDRVNQCELAATDWTALITHFRQCLPTDYLLAIKEHPRGSEADTSGLAALVLALPNTVLVDRQTSLAALLRNCAAVAGANSTVLYEARLIFGKPVYTYAKSWFTNHEDLFIPLFPPKCIELPQFERVENPELMRNERLQAYTNWFLAQLLGRQISRTDAKNPRVFREKVHRLSYHSYLEHGEAIFEP